MSGTGGSGVSKEALAAAAQNLQLPPLRSLDDFALGSARFQLPNLKDWDRWGNRVVKNLLYYQTNYFLMFITIYALMLFLYPSKIVCGLFLKAVFVVIFLHFFRAKSSSSTKSKMDFIASRAASRAGGGGAPDSREKWLYLAGALLFGYLLLHWFDAILLCSFTLLLPFSLTFVHASLRLRNIKNKMANTMESFGPSTPMGVFLDAFNITVESILS